jgi:hypothetical protein
MRNQVIHSDPGSLSGTPVFVGTRMLESASSSNEPRIPDDVDDLGDPNARKRPMGRVK